MCQEYGCDKPIEPDNLITGICNECYQKNKTCTVCGKTVEPHLVYITVDKGKETGRGHQECLKAVI